MRRDADMEVSHTVIDGIVEMRLEGRLDSYWATHLDKTLAKSVREGLGGRVTLANAAPCPARMLNPVMLTVVA